MTAHEPAPQVPCGIFDDPVRVELMKEDAATVRKAMVQINDLSGQGTPLALNQVHDTAHGSHIPTGPQDAVLHLQATRWITVKEDSAKNIITTVRYVPDPNKTHDHRSQPPCRRSVRATSAQ